MFKYLSGQPLLPNVGFNLAEVSLCDYHREAGDYAKGYYEEECSKIT